MGVIGRPDKDRRKRQADRLVRVLMVHKLSRGIEVLTQEQADSIAIKLGVSQRTIYRDFNVLKKLYVQLGTKFLD